jgi:hypothetical protein
MIRVPSRKVLHDAEMPRQGSQWADEKHSLTDLF